MPVSESLSSEITSAVEQVVVDNAAPAETPTTETTTTPETPVETTETVETTDGSEETPTPETPTPETPAATEKKPEPAKPSLSNYVIERAVRAGIPMADAQNFTTDEVLLRAVDIMEAAKKPVETKQETTPEADPLAAFPVLDTEHFEPEVIKVFDQLKGVIAKQQDAIKAFQSQTEQAARSSQEATAREVTSWFDTQVAKLGEDFSEALGTGNYDSLDRGSPQFAKREAIAEQVANMLAGYQARGKQAPPRDELFDVAARFVLRDEYQKAHEQKLAGDLAKRSTQHINRAGGQKNKTNQSPLEETAALLDEKFFGKR